VYVVFCFLFLVVSTSAIDCLERLKNDPLCVEWEPTHSLTQLLTYYNLASFSLVRLTL